MDRLLNYKLFLLIVLALSPVGQALSHPGHDDPVTISRATHVYMQNIVPHYLEIQKGLAADILSDAVKDAAKSIETIAKKARRKESDSSGKKMYKGVAKSAAFIHSAVSVSAARLEFDELNNTLMPFFDHWPSHIKEHDLVLYTCNDTEQWWLQKNGEEPADPFRGGSVGCSDLVEKEG